MTDIDNAATLGPDAAQTRTVLDRLGGWQELLDGAVPPVVFVATNAVAGVLGHQAHALPAAALAASITAGGLALVRLLTGQSVKGVLRGLAGLALAVAFALWTGQARDFFLPGILVDASYAVVLAGSAVVGHPLVAHGYAVLFGIGSSWRDDPQLRKVLTIATWGFAAMYALRASFTWWLYLGDEAEVLALVKLALGWPLTAAGVVLTVGAARKAQARRAPVS